MRNESWKPIPGFLSYFASTRGRVGSMKRAIAFSDAIHVMKPIVNTDGNNTYRLRKNGTYFTISGPRAIALTYIENPEQHHFAQRIDLKKGDVPKNVHWVKSNRRQTR